MTTTITRAFDSATINPYTLIGLRYTRVSGNTVHPVIGLAVPDVTMAVASTREGTLTFLCLDRASALALETFHLTASTYTLVDTIEPAANITYVLADGGAIGLELAETGKRWLVTIDVKAVA